MSRKCLIIRNNVCRKTAPKVLRNFIISILEKRNCLDFKTFFDTYVIKHNQFSLSLSKILEDKKISFKDFLTDESICKEKDLNTIYKSLKKKPRGFLEAMKIWSESRKKKRYFHINRVTNRCIVSGRKNSLSLFGICRVQIRDFHALGKIPGLLKN